MKSAAGPVVKRRACVLQYPIGFRAGISAAMPLCGGTMKRTIAAGILLMLVSLPLFAQNTQNTDEHLEYFGGLHRKGSQIIALNIGMGIPLFILPEDPLATESRPLGLGASFSLSYQYFVANRFTIGGSLTGAFSGTVGGRTLFVAPIAFKMGYWWGRKTLEYNVGLDLGMSFLRLSGNGMITPFAKLGGGLFASVSESWSLGGQVYWWFIPEIHTGSYSDLTRYGNFLEISVGALYHF